jgi:hypothetical protein
MILAIMGERFPAVISAHLAAGDGDRHEVHQVIPEQTVRSVDASACTQVGCSAAQCGIVHLNDDDNVGVCVVALGFTSVARPSTGYLCRSSVTISGLRWRNAQAFGTAWHRNLAGEEMTISRMKARRCVVMTIISFMVEPGLTGYASSVPRATAVNPARYGKRLVPLLRGFA